MAKIADLVKSRQTMVSIVGASGWTPMFGRAPLAPTRPGAPKLRSEAYEQVRCNDEVEAQRRSWTFYETFKERIGDSWDTRHSLGFRTFP